MQNDSKKLYKSGYEKYEKDQFEGALKDFNKVIKNDPTFALAYCMRGLTKFKLKKIKSAWLDLNKAIEFEPKKTFILANRGLVYYKTRKYTQAFEELNKVLQLDPEYESAFSLRIVIKAKLGYFRSAINDYNLFITKYPKNKSELPYILSNLESIIKDVDNRFNDSYLAIDGNSDSFKTYYVIGLLHYLDEEYEDAEQNFSKAININPNISELYSLRGSVRDKIEMKFFCGEVFDDYKRAYELDPNYEYLFELAKQETLQYNQGDNEEEKLKYVNKFIDEEPYEEDAGEAYYYRANAYFWAEQYEEAVKDYSKAIKFDYSYTDVYLKRGECYFQINQSKKALKDLNKVIKWDDRPEDAYLLRAHIYNYNLKDYKKALEEYDNLIEEFGLFEEAPNCRASVLFKLEEYDKAIKAYTELIKDGYDYEYERRGIAYYKKGDYKKAIKDFNKALKLRSFPNSDIYYYRSCSKRELGDINGADLDFCLYESFRYKVKEPFLDDMDFEYYKINHKRALKDIESTLLDTPKDVELYYKRAMIFVACKHYKEAIQDLNKIIKLDPEYEQAYLERSKIREKQGNIKGKQSDLKNALMLQLKKHLFNDEKKIILYLYRPLNQNTFDLLTNNNLWFSHPSEFNDPLDSRFYQHATQDKDLQKILQDIRIRSFAQTDVEKNTLLWSHYADKHTGIAIEYEIDTNSLKDNNIILCRVDYSHKLMKDDYPDFSDYGRSFFIKSKNWEYENEWRMVTLAENLQYGNKLNKCFKIKSVTFGLMADEEDISIVKKIVKEKCKYYKMQYYDKLRMPFTIEKKRI